jgi:2-methylcitrate dehydratase PrpD
MPPAEGDIGWSQTGVAAGIGAAAAAAKALGLDRQRTTWALAIAAQEACGFRAAHGSMAATLIFGHAAQSGLRAALLARQGLSAPQAALEGKFGFMSLFASRPHLPYLTEGLGTRFEVEALAYKPYPCGVVIHPALDAALAWRKQHSDPSLVERVRLRVHPSAQELGFRRHPANVLEAKVSLFHWVAAALATGRAGLAEGQRACMDDAAVVRLRELIELQADAAMRADAAELAVALRDGREQDIAICPSKGSVANPMTDEDLSTKFRGQAAMTLAAAPAGQVLEACWNIDRLQDVAQVARMARALPPV